MTKKPNNDLALVANSLKIIILVLICLNLLIPYFLRANPQEVQNEPESGVLYVTNQQQQRFTALSLTTDVEMIITGLTARVKVTQMFKNNYGQWMEGKYLFPLPDNAAVDQLSIKIGERIIIGEIKEKKAAKKIYQQAKISGKKASLIEQHRANLFSNSIANIAPYETIEVTIEYQQDVLYDNQEGFSLRFPMTITPRYQPDKIYRESFNRFDSGLTIQNNQFKWLLPHDDENFINTSDHLATIKVTLDSGIPLKTLKSTSHKIFKQQKSERHYEISFSEQRVKADHDFILTWQPIESLKPRAALFTERKAGENYLSMMIMPPSSNQLSSISPKEINREIIFVIDTSGSMAGISIKQAKKALAFGLTTLTPADKFNVIQFNSVTNKIFSTAKIATAENIKIAKNYVSHLTANGGTEMFSAVEASLDGQKHHALLRQVIFLTDGAISNESELFKLIDQRLGDSRLYTVGIGSAPNAFFMKKAARFGRGTFTFISDLKQAQQKIETLFNKISRPQLTHINIQWPDTIIAEVWPDRTPDLYDGKPLWLKAKVNRFQGKISISGRLNQTLWQSDLSLDNSKQQAGVAVLWAREKIASIMHHAFHGQVNDQQKRQIIDTALEHHLVSRFTSLVAVDQTPSRVAEQLHPEIIKNLKPKGQTNNQPTTSPHSTSLSYAATSLDLDIDLRHSLYLLLFSLLTLIIYRRLF